MKLFKKITAKKFLKTADLSSEFRTRLLTEQTEAWLTILHEYTNKLLYTDRDSYNTKC